MCPFQDTLPHGCRCTEGEEEVWGRADFNVLNNHFMLSLFHLSRHSDILTQEDSCAFLTAFHFTQSQKMLFSTLIHGVATHLITSAANLTQSMPLNGELIFVFCALPSYPPAPVFLQFNTICLLSSSEKEWTFSLHTQGSRGAQGLIHWKRLKTEERKQKETTCSCTK